jgi:hypothetical protein
LPIKKSMEDVSSELEMEIGEDVNLSNSENTAYIKFELGIRDFGCGLSDLQIKKLFVDFNNL